MQKELKEAYVERKMETDHTILWIRDAANGDDEEVGATHHHMIDRIRQNYSDAYDSQLKTVLATLDENGIEEDVFFAFDVVAQDILMSLAEANYDMENRLGDWEYWADELYDSVSEAVSNGRPW